MSNITRLDEHRSPDFLTEDMMRQIHEGVLRDLADDPLTRVETLREGYETLSCRVTTSQLLGFIAEAFGKSAGLATAVSMGSVHQTEAAVIALEDTAALALEAARTLREQGTEAA